MHYKLFVCSSQRLLFAVEGTLNYISLVFTFMYRMSMWIINADDVLFSLILPCCPSFQIDDELLFLKAVSLCHTVQISYDQPDCLVGGGDPFSHANGFSSHMEYYASSPDEKALVEAAKR